MTNASDIYNDGTYLTHNPDLHVSDTFFKFTQLQPLLERIQPERKDFAILDIGGGAGVLGQLVALFFHHRGHQVQVTAADVSRDMLSIQQRNNPFITRALVGDAVAAFTPGTRYDLTLGIDVFEHMPDYAKALSAIQHGSDWLICNMPIERNLCDILRNAYMRGRYYTEQTRTLGHVHFFSYAQHLSEFSKYFDIVEANFCPYWTSIYQIASADHDRQLQHPVRRLELQCSRWVSRLAPYAAPHIVQGSCFSLNRPLTRS